MCSCAPRIPAHTPFRSCLGFLGAAKQIEEQAGALGEAEDVFGLEEFS